MASSIWNIAVDTLTYNTLKPNSGDTAIEIPQLKVLNYNNDKSVTIKYDGNANYEFTLPDPPSTDYRTVLVSESDGEKKWLNVGELTGDANTPPAWVTAYLLSQPAAAQLNTTSAVPSRVSITWTNPSQIEAGFTTSYLPLANVAYIKLTYYASEFAEINNQTSSAFIYNASLDTTKKLQDEYINELRIVKEGLGTFTLNGRIGTYSNAMIFGSFTVEISFYNSDLSATPNKLILSNLSFPASGSPGVPSVVLQSGTYNTQQLSITPSAISDTVNPSLTLGLPDAAKISNYYITYTPVSSAKRYGGVFNTNQQITNLTLNPYLSAVVPTSTTISNLFPDTSYTVKVQSKNSVNGSLSGYSSTLNFTTGGFAFPGSYIDTASITPDNQRYQSPLKLKVGSTVSTITLPVFPYNYTNGITIDNGSLGTHLYENRGSSNTNIMKFTIKNTSSVITECTTNGFSNDTVNVTNNIVSGEPIMTLVTASPIDSETNSRAGFYRSLPVAVSCNFNNVGIGSLSLSEKYQQRSLSFIQTFVDNTASVNTTKNITFAYYIGDVESSSTPVVTDAVVDPVLNDISTGGSWTQISGVYLCTGNTDLTISHFTATNMGSYFYIDNPVTFTYMGTQRGTVVSSLTAGFDLSSNQIALNPVKNAVVTAAGSGGYAYMPSITLYAKNIRLTSNEGSLTLATTLVSDPISYTKVTNTKNSVTISGSLAIGQHMKSPTTITDTATAFSEPRTTYDHTHTLTDINDLMLSNGLYCSPSFSGVNSPYKNYNSITGNGGRNYSGISKTPGDYRFVTFRWLFSGSSLIGGLSIKIDGVSSSDPTAVLPLSTLRISTGSKLRTKDGKDIRLYYRFEDTRVGKQDPANEFDTQTKGSISTVWIDANSNNVSQYFGRLMGLNAYNTVLGGQTADPTVNNDNSVTYSLFAPSFVPSTYGGVYVYAALGLPSDCDIACNGIYASSQ